MAGNHVVDLYIYDMVLNRLPFLARTVENETLVSNFILEIMYELEPCLKVDSGNTSTSLIGIESNYTIPQRALIADVVSCYILTLQILANIGGTAGTSGTIVSNSNTYLSKAKAGSVEVTYNQFDTKVSGGSDGSGGLSLSGDKLLAIFKASAARKAAAMGCKLNLEEGVHLVTDKEYDLAHFRVVLENCGGVRLGIPERGINNY